ncbi:MAG: methyltransferase domain-containing protein [Actinomycetales bacterium]|nr:methyltransferase domain-containing protein [Actinomycetales bacterium]
MTQASSAPPPESGPAPAWAGRRTVDPADGRSAARLGWDADAARYQREHGDYLAGPGEGDLVWSPEGWLESELALLGSPLDLGGKRVLDLGCGAGQAARWIARQVGATPGGWVAGVDVSGQQLRHGLEWSSAHPRHPRFMMLQADAYDLPFADASVDVIVSAFGVMAFVPDLAPVLCEAARVLSPGGYMTVSLPHPVRWMFPDDPVAAEGMTVATSYFDRTPYVEVGADGRVMYAEYHHTLQDLVSACAAAGLAIARLWEPQWRGDRSRIFGGWSAETVDLVPKTLIVRLEKR